MWFLYNSTRIGLNLIGLSSYVSDLKSTVFLDFDNQFSLYDIPPNLSIQIDKCVFLSSIENTTLRTDTDKALGISKDQRVYTSLMSNLR